MLEGEYIGSAATTNVTDTGKLMATNTYTLLFFSLYLFSLITPSLLFSSLVTAAILSYNRVSSPITASILFNMRSRGRRDRRCN